MKRRPVTPQPVPAPRLHGAARDCWDCGNPYQVVTVSPVRLDTAPKGGSRGNL